MKVFIAPALLALGLLQCSAELEPEPQSQAGWTSLFDGSTLDGWRVSGNAASFRVENGAIVANGPVAHLFYDGTAQAHRFQDFELQLEVMTFPRANSGVYIHTGYQPSGFPEKGYEVQVNNSHSDPKRTGSIYNSFDVLTPPAPDSTWFTIRVEVRGKRVRVSIDGRSVADWTEPSDKPSRLTGGTIALQAHDPGSKVFFRNIRIRPLSD